MSKLFMGSVPKSNPSLGIDNSSITAPLLSITRSGTFGSSMGIQGLDGSASYPSTMTQADTINNIIFDTRFKYLKRLLSGAYSVSLPGRSRTGGASVTLLASVVSTHKDIVVYGRIVGSPNFGIDTGLCTSSGTRFVSFIGKSTLQNDNINYLNEIFAVESWTGYSSPAITLSVEVNILGI